MSLKICFLHSHLDFFPLKLGAASDEHGERFHQNIYNMEEKYARKSSQNLLADYCWNLTEEVSIVSYRQMSYRKKLKT
jgi:hypothetical protein